MNPKDKSLSDPTYGASDFRKQLFGGSLRWLASVLGLASLGLFLFISIDSKTPEIDFPIHLQGKPVFWATGAALAIWLWLALVNWKNWFWKQKLQR